MLQLDWAWYNAARITLEVPSMFLRVFFSLMMILGLLQPDGNTLFKDDFATRVGRWSLPDTAKAKVDFAEGQLHIRIISPGKVVTTLPDTDLELSRYRLSVQAQFLESSLESALGVVLNYQDDENFYWLECDPKGQIALQTMRDGRPLLEPILEGQVTMTDEFSFVVTVTDGEFQITVNQIPLPIVQDRTFASGFFGLYARAGHGSIDAAFDNLLVVDVP
jgi:hypothetical protein